MLRRHYLARGAAIGARCEMRIKRRGIAGGDLSVEPR
jgi:hypothetical protein